MKENVIEIKSFKFAIKIVGLYKYLTEDKKEYILSKQLLRSGTSIGANVAESQNAQSTLDFINKMSIALKETSETRYWLRLLTETKYLNAEESQPVITIIVSRNSVILHCFDTKSYIWYRIFFENSTLILSMTVMQNCVFEKQFC